MKGWKVALLVVVVLAVAGAGTLAVLVCNLKTWYETPTGEAGKTVTLTVPAGTSLRGALDLLQSHGLIEDHPHRRFLSRVVENLPAPRAGEFELSAGQSPKQLLEALATNVEKQYRVTIPEGLRIEEIAQLIEKAGMGSARRFTELCRDPAFVERMGVPGDTLEGYLLPETYSFPKPFVMEKIVERMVRSTQELFTPEIVAKFKAKGLTLHEAVNLAAIVEKETGAASERPVIASVYLNRLKKGMILQADPTVIYGLKDFDGNLTRAHLRDPHPYNTYVHPGLPKGPIANPGKEAILAVADPAKTDFLYFVAMNNGRHKFSKTLKEHNAAVHRYQIRGEVGSSEEAQ